MKPAMCNFYFLQTKTTTVVPAFNLKPKISVAAVSTPTPDPNGAVAVKPTPTPTPTPLPPRKNRKKLI